VGFHTRPVLLGPRILPAPRQGQGDGLRPLSLLDRLLPVYESVSSPASPKQGAVWIQLDEPALALDTRDEARKAFTSAYERLSGGFE